MRPLSQPAGGEPLDVGPARRLVAVAALALLAASLAGETSRNTAELCQLALQRVRNWRDLEARLKAPGAGLEGLPREITAAKDLLESQRAETFRLSAGIRADDYSRQRIEEVSWPIAFDPASPLVLRREGEETACVAISALEGLVLDRCE